MSMGAKASIRLKFSNEKQIDALLSALTPETQVMPTKRASVKLAKDGLFLVLSVEAEDTIAIRATINSYLRWISSTINVIGIVEKSKST